LSNYSELCFIWNPCSYRYFRSRGTKPNYGTVDPGWFDPGAAEPYFDAVDVRTTQMFIYDQYKYVTSDLNPGVVFISNDLEFNPMTKYFYTDRTVPKKRLTEDEMLEINRLYRVIASCRRRGLDLLPIFVMCSPACHT